MMILYKNKPDTIGILASSLCLVHCMLTPLLFIAQAQVISHEASVPFWWNILDFVFLIISFFAIHWSTKTTSKQWVKSALWLTWLFLGAIIINEKLHLISIPEYTIYIPAVGLVFLHQYNKKFCQCKEDQCCATNHKK